jgi:general secretion pathway protein D
MYRMTRGDEGGLVQSVGWHDNVRRIPLLCAGALLLCSLAGCSASNRETAVGGAHRDPLEVVRNADLRAHFPAGGGGQTENSKPAYEPLLFPGSAVEEAPTRTPASGDRMASAEGVSLASGGGVEINFDRADIHAVAKTLLGDTLGINVVVDPRVQGTVTLAATGPIPRKDVLPVFESVLRMSNVAVVREGEHVKIVPVAEATGTGILAMGEGQPGFGVSVVPLHYVSAAAVARTAENFLARPGALKIDPARNLVLIQGTTAERQAALDVVSAFDVEWMRNQSVGVYPLKSTSPENMIKELERVFEAGEGGVGQGMVRFQPISRMNAVLVVSKNPKFLERATQWVQRLDRSDTSGTTVRVYRLKYGSAPQTAKILNEIFLGQRSGQTTRDTPGSQIAPGSSASQSRLDALSTADTGKNGSTPAQNGATTGATGSRVAGPIEAAFQNFDRKDRDSSDTTMAGSSGGSSDTQNRGLFQNMRITADTADNSIVVYSNQEDYRVVERALREIDRPRLQVAIEATVAEVTLTDGLQFGVQYFFRNSFDKGSVGFLPGAIPTQTPTPTVTDSTGALQTAVQAAFIQRVLPGFNLLLGSEANPRVILNALSTITDVKVLSAPSVVVMDNQPALLQVGDEIPISTGVATLLSNANTPVVNTIEMRNTGVILKVLPHVYSNGSIQMEIEQEISNVVNPNQSLTPTISQRRVHSTIAVTSGQTVLLGGLISDQTQKTKAGLPILNEIPVIGNIFGNTSGQKQRTEIIMFIKPQLVRNSLDARQVAEDFRSSLELMRAGDPVVGIGKAPPPVVIPLGKAAIADPIGK